VVTRVCVSVCLPVRCRTPTLLYGPGCNLGAWQKLPPSCALLGWFAIGTRVGLLCQHNANASYKLASIQRCDDIVRTAPAGRGLHTLLAGDWRVTGAFSKLRAVYGKLAWLARRWLAVDGGVLNITAAAWTAGFHWGRSGEITRTQNVSEYMLVLAVCLIYLFIPNYLYTIYSIHLFIGIFIWKSVYSL